MLGTGATKMNKTKSQSSKAYILVRREKDYKRKEEKRKGGRERGWREEGLYSMSDVL